MSIIGRGVFEIRIRDAAGAFRVFYVVKKIDTIYILHVFQKKTQETPKKEIDLARKRYETIKGV